MFNSCIRLHVIHILYSIQYILFNSCCIMLCMVHFYFQKMHTSNTPPKINIEPENDGLEDQRGILRFHVNLPGVYSHAANIIQMSNEKNLGWLGYTRDYTTQLYRAYNKPL